MLNSSPVARVLLAIDGRDAVGLATYSFLWPATGVTASLYLKELYVRDSYRGHGIGRRLMARLGAIAAESDCARIEWTADRDNAHAQAFYAHLGLATNTEKIMYRVNGVDLIGVAEQS